MNKSQSIAKFLTDYGFKAVNNKAYEYHARRTLEDHRDHRYYIYPIRTGGYAHVALFSVFNKDTNAITTGMAYTLAGDDILYGLSNPWRNIVCDSKDRALYNQLYSILCHAEYSSEDITLVSTRSQFIPSRYRHGTVKAHTRGWFNWFLHSVRATFSFLK